MEHDIYLIIFGIIFLFIILTHTIGYCYKYSCATYDCFCAPGSYLWFGIYLYIYMCVCVCVCVYIYVYIEQFRIARKKARIVRYKLRMARIFFLIVR